MITVCLYNAGDLPGWLVYAGQGRKNPIHVAYELPGEPGNQWTISAEPDGVRAWPAPRMANATVRVGLPLQKMVEDQVRDDLVAYVGHPYGYQVIAADVLKNIPGPAQKIAEVVARQGVVCSSMGAIALSECSPDTYEGLFSRLDPYEVEPIDWALALTTLSVSSKEK